MTVLFPSIFTPIEGFFREVLIQIHQTTNLPWAWSIIALTCIVRLAIFPVTAKQTQSTLSMQRLQPYIKQLQQKHKDDRAALNQAMMEFYRDNNVNPLASCFPLLIQIPIFTGLFFLLKDFKAPANTTHNFTFLFGFIGDIRDKINDTGVHSFAAAGWILLVFYVASQMLSSYTMMNSPDPRQKTMFMLLPIVFVPFIKGFPVGVMLYWITTNLWSLGQYLLVVQLANRKPVEVVLPADSKGRKKVIVPKDQKAKAAAAGAKGSKGAAGGQNAKAKAGKSSSSKQPQGRSRKKR
jgi:YidC/Oxa1 family membrane protein insertase